MTPYVGSWVAAVVLRQEPRAVLAELMKCNVQVKATLQLDQDPIMDSRLAKKRKVDALVSLPTENMHS